MMKQPAKGTRKQQVQHGSRVLFKAVGENEEEEQSISRCLSCKAAFLVDATFCDQCGSRRRRDTIQQDLTRGAKITDGKTACSLDNRSRSSGSDSQDASDGGWFWGRECVLPSTSNSDKPALLPLRGDPNLPVKDCEPQSAEHEKSFEVSLAVDSLSNNQSSHSSQRSRSSLDDANNKARHNKASVDQVAPAGKALCLPLLGVSTQRTQSQKLTKPNQNGHNEKHTRLEDNAPAASSFVLWGSCLDEAISSFQATEIILVAEIDSDERCMFFLKQQLRMNDQQQQRCHMGSKLTRKSPQLTQLEMKVVALEKSICMNKQKLVSVRDRLEELRRSESSNLIDSNNDNNNSDDRVSNSSLKPDRERVEVGCINSPQQNGTERETKALPKKKKTNKSRHSHYREPGQGDIKSVALNAVLTVQKVYGKFKKASRRGMNEEAETAADTNPPTCLTRFDSSNQSLADIFDIPADLNASEAQPLLLETAAIRIQSIYRRRAGRAALRRLLAEVYEKVLDPESSTYYYYSKRTKQSQWEKPALLGEHDLADVAETTITPADSATSAANGITELDAVGTNLNEQHRQAAQKIQRIYRSRATRLFLRDLAMGNLEKVFDADFGAWYYFNHRTQQSFWEKPEHAQLRAAAAPSGKPR